MPIIDYKGLGIPEPEEDDRSSASGLVPEGTTYGQWLRGQPKAERERILGPRAKYFDFLSDKFGPEDAIKKFVRQDGAELTLDQLRRRYPDATAS